MDSLLIRNARLDGKTTDALIIDGIFKTIAPSLSAPEGVEVLNAKGKILAPAFYNAHAHSAMTLFRGYADDMELFTWLNKYIWPAEAHLTPDDVYIGTKLAIVEMIRSGTVFFNDMYWDPAATLRAADEMGMRAMVGRMFIEESPGKILDQNIKASKELEKDWRGCSGKDRIKLTYGPHAIYTVSEITLKKIAEEAKITGDYIHIHAAETKKEVDDCIKANGITPIAVLDRCGILTPKTVLAHCVHLTKEDMKLIRARGSIIAHMPISNYKLCSGALKFKEIYEEIGCRFTIGTDGCASNNNLSMFDEMKLAALSAKLGSGDPSSGAAADILRIATEEGAEAFGIHGGKIAEGYVGDAILLNPELPCMVPESHLDANIVYSADTSCVDTVICDGKILMEDRFIRGEQEIIEAARRTASNLLKI